ncbi:MAG: cytochrome c biogenesis protein [Melioribacteraceae bacterium]|nr:cytochrome c biogenesis protein [Melioribacteraceae bacterium]MCF8264506.1 cytochrome c biogenesis protein [Melioribacteraceae bacterium]MCF8412472.1 cytochrome c biogenesis protein [Melioribacteraceae bacterium]MCF8432034.1 cytochrome c biogenesis protein [Melioribacteraceae bacterium]
MLSTIHLLNILLPILYLVAFVAYTYDFIGEASNFTNSKRIFLFVTLFLHTVYLLFRTIEFTHAPITNKFEIFTLLAFAVSFSYFILELMTDVRGTGLFIIVVSFAFQTVSSIFIQDLVEVKDVLRNGLLGIHVVSAIMGYSGFTISAVYGILFIVLYKNIRNSKFGIVFKRLPSLEILETLSFKSLLIGYVLLTIAILIGVVWLPTAFPDFKWSDPKLISSGVVWLIYTAGITIKLKDGWYGKRVIFFSLTGFTVAISSMILSNFLAESFHSFY